MSYLVAAIEHHARKLAQAVTRAVAEKCSGYSDYEAGDFLTDEQAMSIAVEETRAMRAERAERWRQVFVDADAPQEDVAEPWYCGNLRSGDRTRPPWACTKPMGHAGDHGWVSGAIYWPQGGSYTLAVPNPDRIGVVLNDGTLRTERVPESSSKRFTLEDVSRLMSERYDVCGFCFHMRREHERPYTGACSAFVDPQTPTAGQRGESPVGDDSPTSPAGSPDPSPTSPPASQPRVGGEGSPADSDIPPSPAGERPNWRTWAAPAICDVLANHTPDGSDIGIWCTPEWADFRDPDSADHARHFTDWQDWRDHVSDLIAERLDTAWRARQSQKPQK